ncbi:Sec-independent protein translocase subunit TatA [Streptomyces sp. NPDC003758]|jgi:sec-independent protein translocase protein TatA|uniref:Sec-independent protein translocase protein TatA n=1 Tax=Streptomyces cynarae TaxID=2981134 RepID=A0ABY6E8W7_9ACTN|nr:Sec-independent protein translocase subunit TatA [Streptomyces cynarae]UXY22343.1 Sec-independent protein translocase subunit TatA [Streptomyces cynarae]
MLRNGLEPWHLLIVAIVVIVLFGSKKLPDTARALGKSMRILKSEAKAMKDENASAPAASAPTPVEPTAVRTSAETATERPPATAG